MRDITIAMEPVAAPLSRVARTASEFDLLGTYHLMKGDYDGGLAYEKRAMAADFDRAPQTCARPLGS